MTRANKIERRTLRWTMLGTVSAIMFGLAALIVLDASHESRQGARLTTLETSSLSMEEKLRLEHRLTSVEKDVKHLEEDILNLEEE